ncbi:MAG TPA: hypothetical protein VHN80_27240, partial [Kineosporiaceae bacterium]|nr:hypothetical protein [Kineosporiaceae bacterium]
MRLSRFEVSSAGLPIPPFARRRVVVTRPPTRTGTHTNGGQHACGGFQGPRDETEVGPLPALLTFEDPGVDEDLQVVGDG